MAQLNAIIAQQQPVQQQTPQQLLDAAAACYAAQCAAGTDQRDSNFSDSGDESDGPEQLLLEIHVPMYNKDYQEAGGITGKAETDRLLHRSLVLDGQTSMLGSGSEGTAFAMAPAPGSCGNSGCALTSLCAQCQFVRSIVVKKFNPEVINSFSFMGGNVFKQLLTASNDVKTMGLQGTCTCEYQLRVGWQHQAVHVDLALCSREHGQYLAQQCTPHLLFDSSRMLVGCTCLVQCSLTGVACCCTFMPSVSPRP
jgi:hypothetical protein